MQATPQQLLTRGQAARALNISVDTLDRLVAANRIGSVRIGRARRFTQQHLGDYLTANESRPKFDHVPGQLALFDLPADPPMPPTEARLAA